MAFNPSNFIKSTAKSAGDKILNEIVNNSTTGMPTSVISSAKSITESLFNVGASFESISSFASQKTDSIVNQGSDHYYALTGKDPARAAAVDIAKRRRANIDDTSSYLEQINPATKIKSKRNNNSPIINAVM